MTMAISDIVNGEIVNDTMDLPELATLANGYHIAAEGHARNALAAAWHAGRALNAAKAKCEHGKWTSWLEKNFDGASRTAQDYMKIASNTRSSADLESFSSINEALKSLRPEPKPKPKPEPEPDNNEEVAVVIEDLMTNLWDAAPTLGDEAKAGLAADLRALTDNLDGVKRDRKAERAAAVETLRDGRTGVIPTTMICELIVNESAAPTPQMASWLADAITTKFGSWSAFDKGRREYSAQRAKEQQAVSKNLGIK